MRARQKVSRAGVELIKSFEGLRSTAARLPDGRWTLGYGHTFSAREGARVTQEDADALLRFDLLPIVDSINNLVLVPLNQNQFDALVSFCFNIGVDNFGQSSVLKCINEGRVTEAALAMDSWRSAEFNGQTYVLAPLIRRRAAEKNLFLTPDENTATAPSLLVRPMPDTAPETAARPSEVNAPDRGGVLSAYPMSAPGFSPYANPVAQPVAAPQPAPERQVVDLNAYAPRPADLQPYPAPRENVVEHLPDGLIASSAMRETPPVDAEPRLSPEAQAALARAQDEQRLREEAERQAATLAAARADQARREQDAFERGRLERERIEREQAEYAARLERDRADQMRREQEERDRADQLRREQEERDRADQARRDQEERARADQARREQEERDRLAATAAVVAAPVVDEDPEKARKAEAAAALMRLYSPYGGTLGRPLAAASPAPKPAEPAPQPVETPAAPAFTPYQPKPVAEEFSNQSVIAPSAAESAPVETVSQPAAPMLEPVPAPEDDTSNVVDFTPIASPRTMEPPTVVALNPYGRNAPAAEPEAAPDVVEVPRPQAIDLSATPAFQPQAQLQPAQPVHWREQLQRPLPENYQNQDDAQANLIGQTPSHYESLYNDDNEEWTIDGGRVAVASDETHHEPVSWWRMVLDTVWMLIISVIGLGCLGVAAAAYTKSHDPMVIRNGFFNDYTSLSLIMAVLGVLFVSISVYLIMKRLGGLRG